MTTAKMSLGAFLMSSGHHLAAWRHPRASAGGGLDFQHFKKLATTAERGKGTSWSDLQRVDHCSRTGLDTTAERAQQFDRRLLRHADGVIFTSQCVRSER